MTSTTDLHLTDPQAFLLDLYRAAVKDAGLKGFDMGTWFGVLAPASTPREVLARLGADMNRIIESPQFRRKMEEIGAEPIGGSPEQMARQIRDDTDRFARLVKDAKVALD